jgi:Mg2+ and Co2+ transporter CorA
MRSLHFDTSLLLDQKQESLKPQKFYIVFGVSPKGARFLVTVHSAQYDWLEELKQKATFEGYMDYPYRLANLLYGILQRLVDSYQQMLYFTDQFMDDLEDAAREGVNSWRVPQRIRDIVVAAKERDFQDNKARKKDPEEIRRQREWSKQHKFAPKVRTKVQQSDEDYLQTIIFRTKRALSRMRDVMLPEDNAIHEFVIHAKYHASQKSEGDKLRIVDERLATYFEDLRQHLDVLDAMLQSRRDHLSELININMAMVSNRLNQIMHQLTRFAAIFLPITFITGFFGQNFWGTSGLLPFFTDPVQFLVLGMSTSLALIVGSYFFFNWYFNRGVKNTK